MKLRTLRRLKKIKDNKDLTKLDWIQKLSVLYGVFYLLENRYCEESIQPLGTLCGWPWIIMNFGANKRRKLFVNSCKSEVDTVNYIDLTKYKRKIKVSISYVALFDIPL